MSKSAYFRIGLFVFVSVAIAVVGLVLFGQRAARKPGVLVETYLDESVEGLVPGSPVKFKGLKVGVVQSVEFVHDTYADELAGKKEMASTEVIVVVMSIDKARFASAQLPPDQLLPHEVAKGLRVRLATQGVSSASYMEFDYIQTPSIVEAPFSTTPARHEIQPNWTPQHIVVPSVPSTARRLTDQAEDLLKTFNDARVDQLAKQVSALVSQVSVLVDKTVKPTVETVNGSVQDLKPTIENLNEASKELAPLLRRARELVESDLPSTLKTVDGVAGDGREAIRGITKNVDALSGDLSKLLARLNTLLDEDVQPTVVCLRTDLPALIASIQKTLRSVNALVANSEQEIGSVLQRVDRISGEVDELGSYAKKYPAHILFGNPPPPRERK